MKSTLTFLFTAAAIYLVYVALLYFFQRKLIYPVSMLPAPSGTIINPENQRFIQAGDNAIDTRFYLPDSAANVPLLIIAHGNASRVEDWEAVIGPALRMGMAVLLVEYPGYGRSEGQPSQQSIQQAFEAAYDFYTAMEGIDSNRVVYLGRSLGGGVVCQLSRTRRANALILVSTFTSLKAFAPGYGVPAFLLRDTYDSVNALREFGGPVFVIHGSEDRTIPVAHARALRELKAVVRYKEYQSHHNNTPPDWSDFWSQIELFLRENRILG